MLFMTIRFQEEFVKVYLFQKPIPKAFWLCPQLSGYIKHTYHRDACIIWTLTMVTGGYRGPSLAYLGLEKCEMPPALPVCRIRHKSPRRTDATPPQLGIRGMTAQIVTWVVSNSIRFDLTPLGLGST